MRFLPKTPKTVRPSWSTDSRQERVIKMTKAINKIKTQTEKSFAADLLVTGSCVMLVGMMIKQLFGI